MKLQCNTKEFKQLIYWKIYDCEQEEWKVGKQSVLMVGVDVEKVLYWKWWKQRFQRIHFIEPTEQPQEIPQEEEDPFDF